MNRLLIAIILVTAAAPSALCAEVAVIAHPSVPVEAITRAQLLDLYTGDVKEWDNGEPIILIDLKPKTDVKQTFYDYLGKSASRMKSIWMKNMLTGEGKPPESMGSQQDLLQKVASTPGAIGYVDNNLVTGDVRTLTVIRSEDN
jgi:ABC-type phosphate transport system substrate-binding protein